MSRLYRVPKGWAWCYGTHSEIFFKWDSFCLLDVWVSPKSRLFAVTLLNFTWHNLGQYEGW